jgi:TPR repeat protein
LCTFAEISADGMSDGIVSWVASEFSGDWAAVAAAAEGGNAKAKYAMGLAPHISYEESCGWMQRAINQGHLDAHLYLAMNHVGSLQAGNVSTLESDKDKVMDCLKLPLEGGSAPAQFVAGMLQYIFDCDSGAQEDFLDAARLIRKAAKQKVAEAQYELGEMFRRGVFCDHVENMIFARKHLRRAARQGHADAVERLKEIRSCAYCGAADAPWKCRFCHLVMYCDYATCCVKHWREGGGVGGGIIVDAGARHRKVCPSTHAAPDDESEEYEEEGEDQEEEEEEAEVEEAEEEGDEEEEDEEEEVEEDRSELEKAAATGSADTRALEATNKKLQRILKENKKLGDELERILEEGAAREGVLGWAVFGFPGALHTEERMGPRGNNMFWHTQS